MRATILNRANAITLGALIAMPVLLLAQEDSKSGPNRVPHYKVTDLGTPPGLTFSQANTISNTGVISGVAAADPASPQRAVVWEHGRVHELGTLGGINSGAFGAIRRERLVAAGQAESAELDPNDENFCAYGTHETCLPVLWDGHKPIPLPTLGGNNGSAGAINSRGEIEGYVETGVRDPDCPGTALENGVGPIVLDYKGVVWGPRLGQKRTLEPLPGDTVSIALWINDKGEAVGISGTCANSVVPPTAHGPHSVLWDRDGQPSDLGNLGSTAGNAALSINNRGEIVGASSPTDQSTPFNGDLAFLWTREKGIKSLGTLPGDIASAALGINDHGEVVGASVDPTGNPRAVVWRHGSIAILNDLAVGDSPFDVLLLPFSINNAGAIVGFGVTTAGDVHGFLATPCDDAEDYEPSPRHLTHQVIPEYIRDMMRQRLGGHRR